MRSSDTPGLPKLTGRCWFARRFRHHTFQLSEAMATRVSLKHTPKTILRANMVRLAPTHSPISSPISARISAARRSIAIPSSRRPPASNSHRFLNDRGTSSDTITHGFSRYTQCNITNIGHLQLITTLIEQSALHKQTIPFNTASSPNSYISTRAHPSDIICLGLMAKLIVWTLRFRNFAFVFCGCKVGLYLDLYTSDIPYTKLRRLFNLLPCQAPSSGTWDYHHHYCWA